MHANSIVDFNFKPGTLVLIWNSRADKDMSKHYLRYFGPMFIVCRTTGSSYILSELNSALSRLRFGTSCLLPYSPRDLKAVPVMSITDLLPADLDAAMYNDVSAI